MTGRNSTIGNNGMIGKDSILYDKKGTALRVHDVKETGKGTTFVVLRPSTDGGSFVEYYQDYQIGRDLFLEKADSQIQKSLLRKDPRYAHYFGAWEKSNQKIRFSKRPVPRDFAYEERHYAKIIDILEKKLEGIIDHNGGGSIAKAEFFARRGQNEYFRERREVDMQLAEPFFARLDYKEENGVYIGKIEIPGQVIDWTDERAALYYEYQLYVKNETYGLTLVRSYDISPYGSLQSISDLYIEAKNNGISEDSPSSTSVIADSHLMKVLKSGRSTKKVHDIIRSIQANQYKIITEPFRKSSLIVGCAGSGKTMILYHRIRYMLRNDTSIRPGKVVILSPTDTLNSESNALTETLQLDQIRKYSKNTFYIALIEKYFANNKIYYSSKSIEATSDRADSFPEETAKELYSACFLNEVLTAVTEIIGKENEAYFRFVEDTHDELIGLWQVFFSNIDDTVLEAVMSDKAYIALLKNYQDARAVFKKASSSSIVSERERLDKEIQRLSEMLHSSNSLLNEQIKQKNDEILEYKIKLSKAERELEKYKKEEEEYEKTGLIGRLLSKRRGKKSDATYQDEVQKKQTDITLLAKGLQRLERELAEIKHKPEKYQKMLINLKEKKSLLKQLEDTSYFIGQEDSVDMAPVYHFFSALDDYKDKGQLTFSDAFDDNLVSVFDMLLSLKQETDAFLKFISAKDKIFYLNRIFEYVIKEQKDVHNLDINYRYHFELFIKVYVLYSYLGALDHSENFFFIDEFQDYSPSELSLLSRMFPQSFFNYYGDYLQCINPTGISGENMLPDCMSNIKQHFISENYRNAREITEYVNKKFHMDMLAIGISGEITFKEQIEFSIQELNTDNRLAVIYSDPGVLERFGIVHSNQHYHFVTQDDSEIVTGKINVLHIQQAKGLEFEKVQVIQTGMTSNELYVAMTRALSTLIIVG